MTFPEPSWGETLYVIALFLFIAIALAPILNWAPTDDRRDETSATGSEPQAEKERRTK